MKSLIYTLGFISLVGLALAVTAGAADSDSVTATVTVQNISVAVTDGTVTYGTLAVSSTASTTSSGLDDSQTATNNGNITEDFDIAGQDSVAWTLESAIGANQYKHSFCTVDCDTTPSWTALTTSYQTLSTSVSSSGTTVFDLKLDTPSSSASYTEQSVDVTVLASAS